MYIRVLPASQRRVRRKRNIMSINRPISTKRPIKNSTRRQLSTTAYLPKLGTRKPMHLAPTNSVKGLVRDNHQRRKSNIELNNLRNYVTHVIAQTTNRVLHHRRRSLMITITYRSLKIRPHLLRYNRRHSLPALNSGAIETGHIFLYLLKLACT